MNKNKKHKLKMKSKIKSKIIEIKQYKWSLIKKKGDEIITMDLCVSCSNIIQQPGRLSNSLILNKPLCHICEFRIKGFLPDEEYKNKNPRHYKNIKYRARRKLFQKYRLKLIKEKDKEIIDLTCPSLNV